MPIVFLNYHVMSSNSSNSNFEFRKPICEFWWVLFVPLSKLEGDGGHLRLAGNWFDSTLRKTVGSWEISWKRDSPDRARFSKERAMTDGCGTQTNSTDFCLMDSGLDKQVLTICLEMHSWEDCLSTMWVMPVGLPM